MDEELRRLERAWRAERTWSTWVEWARAARHAVPEAREVAFLAERLESRGARFHRVEAARRREGDRPRASRSQRLDESSEAPSSGSVPRWRRGEAIRPRGERLRSLRAILWTSHDVDLVRLRRALRRLRLAGLAPLAAGRFGSAGLVGTPEALILVLAEEARGELRRPIERQAKLAKRALPSRRQREGRGELCSTPGCNGQGVHVLETIQVGAAPTTSREPLCPRCFRDRGRPGLVGAFAGERVLVDLAAFAEAAPALVERALERARWRTLRHRRRPCEAPGCEAPATVEVVVLDRRGGGDEEERSFRGCDRLHARRAVATFLEQGPRELTESVEAANQTLLDQGWRGCDYPGCPRLLPEEAGFEVPGRLGGGWACTRQHRDALEARAAATVEAELRRCYPASTPPRRPRLCSRCRRAGHDARSCHDARR